MRVILYIFAFFIIGISCTTTTKVDVKTEEITNEIAANQPSIEGRDIIDTVEYLGDTTFQIGGYQLTFIQVDSTFMPHLYKDHDARQQILARNDNSYAAAKQIEEYLQPFNTQYFQRKDSSLLLFLNNGKTLTLKDNLEEEALYTFEAYISSIDAYLIRIQWYEGNNYILVSRQNGNKIYTIGQVYPSPSGKQMLSINDDLEAGYSSSGLQLLTKEGETIVKRLNIESGDWAPIGVRWLSEKEAILNVIRYPFDAHRGIFKTNYYKMTIK